MSQKSKIWLYKNFSEFFLSLILSLIFLGVGNLLGIIKSSEYVVIGKTQVPVFLGVFLFLYKYVHCTFFTLPTNESKPGK